MKKNNVFELLKEAQATEKTFLEEAGYEDQDVKEAHKIAEDLKLLYMELGVLKEQIEYRKADCKPFKGLKVIEGKKKVLSAKVLGKRTLKTAKSAKATHFIGLKESGPRDKPAKTAAPAKPEEKKEPAKES